MAIGGRSVHRERRPLNLQHRGEKRPADVVGTAVKVMKIATGEIEETADDGKNKAAVELGLRDGNDRLRESGMLLQLT